LSFIMPLYMIKCMCTWRQTWEVWPALLVSGGSFAIFQFTFATVHSYVPGLVLYPMTDIGGGIFSLVLTAIFLKFWKPRHEWHFDKAMVQSNDTVAGPQNALAPMQQPEATSGPTPQAAYLAKEKEQPLTVANVTLAWAPYGLMSVLLLLTGLVRQEEQRRQRLGE